MFSDLPAAPQINLEDGIIVHVDDCGPTRRAKSVLTAKMVGRLTAGHTQARREKKRGADPNLSPDLGGHWTGWS